MHHFRHQSPAGEGRAGWRLFWKRPKGGPHPGVGALNGHHLVAVVRDMPGEVPACSFALGRFVRQDRPHLRVVGGGAGGPHRAIGAPWLLGRAHQRAQFHHGLVVVAWTVVIEPRVGDFLNGLGATFAVHRFGHPAPPAHHPLNVAVDGGHGLAQTDGGDGGRCVRPHTGQGEPVLPTSGEGPAGGDDLRGLVKQPGSAVIPQPFPSLHHVGF